MRVRPPRPLRIAVGSLLLWWLKGVERVLLALLYLKAARGSTRQDVLVWGPEPIINNKHWSSAMNQSGHESITLMRTVYPNFRREDFDLYFDDVLPRWLRGRRIRPIAAPYAATRWVMEHASVIHIPFTGGPLGETRFWMHEDRLLRRSGVKVVVIPYGGDLYRYSLVGDPSLRHALLSDYPAAARREAAIRQRVDYWVERADIVMAGLDLDGLGRWDLPPHNMCALDVVGRATTKSDMAADGISGTVVVAHAPNHRRYKGTEFAIRAVEELRAEGLAVELLLLERVSNDEVQRRFREDAHILLDQLIMVGYGFAAIEGMAAGLPVIVNLDDDRLVAMLNRYSYFSECPLVSGSPETVKDVLRELVRRPGLREELGRAGREYVERYHSYESSARVFGAIHSNLLSGGNTDLMRIFEPELGVFLQTEPIKSPLVRNRLAHDG